MTGTSAPAADHTPLLTDDDVLGRVNHLVGRACRRQLWWMFLDSESVQLPALLPMDGLPEWPPSDTTLLATRLVTCAEAIDGIQFLFVWERLGSAMLTPTDRAWAVALADAAARSQVPLRAQLLSHDGGVRWLAPDDYA